MLTTGSTIWLAEVTKASRARVGLLDREGALFERQPLRRDARRARTVRVMPAQDGVIGRAGDHLAVAA